MSALNIEMRITYFTDVKGTKRSTTWMSLGDFATTAIATTKAPDKASLPLVKLAAFGDQRSSKGSLRHDKNVLEVSGVEIDYDGEELPLDKAVKLLFATRVPAVIYSSPSHRPDKPRWRILAPFSKPLPPERRAQMVSRIAGLFPVEMAPESWALSQAYFYGSIAGQPPVAISEVDGPDFVPVDLHEDLDLTAKAKSSRPGSGKTHADDWFDQGDRLTDEAELRARIIAGGEGTHDALVSLAGLLARCGADYGALIAELTAVLQQRPVSVRNPDWHAHLADVPRLVQWVLQKEEVRRAAAAADDPWEKPHAEAVEPEEIEPEPEEWPKPMGLAAFHGLLGAAAAEIMPHTEGERPALC
jgi:hypothetical protein